MAKKKPIHVVMTVNAILGPEDIDDIQTLEKDLLGELMKIKSGAYKNRFYGEITEVKLKTMR